MVKEFQNDGTYAVGDTGSADAVLRGTVSRIERSQLRSARFNTLRSRELRMDVDIDYELLESNSGTTSCPGRAGRKFWRSTLQAISWSSSSRRAASRRRTILREPVSRLVAYRRGR